MAWTAETEKRARAVAVAALGSEGCDDLTWGVVWGRLSAVGRHAESCVYDHGLWAQATAIAAQRAGVERPLAYALAVYRRLSAARSRIGDAGDGVEGENAPEDAPGAASIIRPICMAGLQHPPSSAGAGRAEEALRIYVMAVLGHLGAHDMSDAAREKLSKSAENAAQQYISFVTARA